MKNEHKVTAARIHAQLRCLEMQREDMAMANRFCSPTCPMHSHVDFKNNTAEYSICVNELQILESEVRAAGEEMHA